MASTTGDLLSAAPPIPQVGVQREWDEIGDELRAALDRVVERGQFILGPEVAAFEQAFANYSGTAAAIGLASGTDALMLGLAAAGIQAGDEVITTTLTSGATATAIVRAGGTPVLVDVEADTLNIDPAMVEVAIGPRTRAVLPVHLYGRPASMAALRQLAKDRDLLLIEDCAQAVGATSDAGPVGTVGDLGCFSFYPTKNLGAYGDGGMVIASDTGLIERLRLLRSYGWQRRDYSVTLGFNSRLDEMQATFLSVKLRHLNRWNARRSEIAARYEAGLSGVEGVKLPPPEHGHVWHLYVVQVPNRDALRTELAAHGVGTGVHYPHPIHAQPAFAQYGAGREFRVAEAACEEIMSLPMHAYLRDDEIDRVIELVRDLTR